MDKTRPIIIIKKKSGHGGQHGGAWKVAYADFVTAMMSLFIVLWLLSSSKPIQEAVGGYFRDPSGTADKKGSTMEGTGENFTLNKDNMPKLKDQLQEKIRQMNDFEKLKSHVEMTITNEGLRIELMESASGTFFDSGSTKLNADGRDLLITLAQELSKLPNKISIEGHTDSKPYSTSGNYSNWELSTDRANAARRLMQTNGIAQSQISQVRGFADQRLRKTDDPLDPSNRRVSLIVQYIPKDAEESTKPSAGSDEKKLEEAIPAKPSAGTVEKKPDEKTMLIPFNKGNELDMLRADLVPRPDDAADLKADLDEMTFRFNRGKNSDPFMDMVRDMITTSVPGSEKLTA